MEFLKKFIPRALLYKCGYNVINGSLSGLIAAIRIPLSERKPTFFLSTDGLKKNGYTLFGLCAAVGGISEAE